MKKVLVLAVALTLGLSACAKRKQPATPGMTHNHDHSHHGDTHVPADKPPVIPPEAANEQVGTWQSLCKSEVTENGLFSYISYLTITKTEIDEVFVEFEGDECVDFSKATQWDSAHWNYEVTKRGSIENNIPYHFQYFVDDEETRTITGEGDVFINNFGTGDQLKFEGEEKTYYRMK